MVGDQAVGHAAAGMVLRRRALSISKVERSGTNCADEGRRAKSVGQGAQHLCAWLVLKLRRAWEGQAGACRCSAGRAAMGRAGMKQC